MPPTAGRKTVSRSRYASQPSTVGEGVHAAYDSVSHGVKQAAHTIIAIPMREYRRTGTQVRGY